MPSSEDFKKMYELYRTEGVPNGVSIVDFYQRNGVIYNQFERWFKKRYWLPQGKGPWSRCRAIRSFVGRGAASFGMFRFYHARSVEQANTPVRLRSHQSVTDDSAKQPNLPTDAVFGGEAGSVMLAIFCATRLWYVSNVTNMRFGKYRIFSEMQVQGMNVYNGDACLFMSKKRRTVKIIRNKNHKRHLYEITFDDDYKSMRPTIEGDEIISIRVSH